MSGAPPGVGARRRPVVCVAGVAGTGKTTVGALLAARLAVPYADGDDLHPPRNIAKMAAGRALDEADRRPWLAAVGRWLAAHRDGAVVSCSALRRAHRDALRRRCPELRLVFLRGAPELLAARLRGRAGHFLGADMLPGQLAVQEAPAPAEAALCLDVAAAPAALVDACLSWLDRPADA